MTEADLIESIGKINRGRGADGQSAPHKPLLLLLAFKLYKDGVEEIPFSTIDEELGWLLHEFSASGKAHAYLPYWHLSRGAGGKFWEVEIPESVRMHKSVYRPFESDLREHGGTGRLRREVIELLRANDLLCDRLVGEVLDKHFPEPLHARILEALGMGLDGAGEIPPENQKIELPANFRREVLLAYNSRCAICDFNVSMENLVIGLEAAHIKWKSWEGPNVVQNGISMCATHHRLFDRGVFTLAGPDAGYEVLISRKAQFSGGLDEARKAVREMRYSLPLREEDHPKAEYLEWHRSNVFEKSIGGAGSHRRQ